MTINEIYNWLLDTDPVEDNEAIREVWTNMASYCYFVNTMDFDKLYQQRLKQVLAKSVRYNVRVPADDHSHVLEIADNMESEKIGTYINSCIHARQEQVTT